MSPLFSGADHDQAQTRPHQGQPAPWQESWCQMTNDWDLSRSGPLITLLGDETVVLLMIAYNQANEGTAVVARWQIDGQITSRRLAGTNESWPEFWEAFLDLVPEPWQPAVAHSELQVRFGAAGHRDAPLSGADHERDQAEVYENQN